MAAFDVTVGAATSTSYVDVAGADGIAPIVVSKTRAAAWTALSTEDKQLYLMRAASLLDVYMDWGGSRVTYDQNLAWPRNWVMGPDHWIWYDSRTIPTKIQEAQVLLAINLAEGFDQDTAAAAPVTSVKVSSISVQFATARAARSSALLPAEVIERLNGFGVYIGTSGSARSVTLERG